MIFNSPISGRPWATARCPRHVEVRHERPLKGMNWAAGKLTVMTVGNGSDPEVQKEAPVLRF